MVRIHLINLQKILLHSESIVLPGINVSTTQAKTFGEFREMPYERTFEPVQMTFLDLVDAFLDYAQTNQEETLEEALEYFTSSIQLISDEEIRYVEDANGRLIYSENV